MKDRLFKSIGQKTNILLVAAAFVVGALTTYAALSFRSATRSSATTSSVRQTPINAVAALGYLEPQGEVIQLSAPAFLEGTRVEQLLVKQGDTIQKGQIVAILDSRDRLQASLQQAQQQVKLFQARLEQVKAGAKTGEIVASNAKFEETKAELEGQINTQRATIANLEAQLQGEKEAQEATVAMRNAELQNAEADCQRYQTLYQNGAVSTQERDLTCLKQQTEQELVQEAIANLNRIIASRDKQIQEAQANLSRTIATQERQIQQAKATFEAVEEVRPVDVRVARMELENALAAVQKAQAELALAYVRSPSSGQILKIHTRPGELVNDRGIVDLGQTDRMYVRAEVYETDISRVKIGQRAIVKTDGIVRELQGTVDEIGLQIGKKDVLGTDPTADADVRVVEVKIRLDAKDSQQVAGLTNLQVNVLITTDLS